MCWNKSCNEFHIGKPLPDTFPIQNGRKQRDCLRPLHFYVALEYTITKVQEIQVGPKWYRTHQFLVCADDVNLLGDSTNAIEKTQKL
jgi:hypothetical protein